MKKTILLPALTTLVCHPNAARHASLWAVLGILAAIAFGTSPTRAAVTEAWVHRYSNVVSNSSDQAVKVVRDSPGDIIVTGTTADGITTYMLTTKYSGTDGSMLWQKRRTNAWPQALTVDGNGNVVVMGSSATLKYAAADGALLWEKHSTYAIALALAVDGSGNVVVTGYSPNGSDLYISDYYTAKYAAADGVLLWEKRYNGPANSDDRASAVAVDDSGNVVVTGYSRNGAPNYDSDSYTAKYSAADGSVLWQQRSHSGGAGAVAVDGNGNVVITGYRAMVKYAAADGALLWEKYSVNAGASTMAVDGGGNVVVTGYSYNTNGYPDYYTAKYGAADGVLLWEKRYNGPGSGADTASAVAVDGSANVVVTGSSYDTNGNSDYYTAKYAAADGILLWEKRYNGLANSADRASAVAVDGSGNLVVTGSSVNSSGNADYYTAKYAAADGALLWEKRYNGAANSHDEAKAVAVDSSDNVVVTGYSYNGFFTDADYYTAKYAAADGALLWENRYNGPANSDDRASAVAVDSSGNVVITGYSYNGASYYDHDYYTAKYAATDGALLWEKRYNGPANSDDRAQALAVDASGNVVVTGYSYNNTNWNTDYYTAKYAAADGALLWEKRYYDGPWNLVSITQALAVDASGNVVVTITLEDFYESSHSYTAKYALADGALLWEKRYNGPANSDDRASSVAVDSSGNVVVAGYSFVASYYDSYTAKYAAADGALLWEQRYNGPANSYDQAQAVGVDGSGNVVVTGYSHNGRGGFFQNRDYYTAKYAAADGALLWEKRYNGPSNGDDSASSLALGPNGIVVVTGSSSGDYATVVYRDDVYPISIALVPSGVRLRFTGIPARSYTIERAPEVTGPWTTIDSPTAPASGLVEYHDAAPPPGQAFYRTVQP